MSDYARVMAERDEAEQQHAHTQALLTHAESECEDLRATIEQLTEALAQESVVSADIADAAGECARVELEAVMVTIAAMVHAADEMAEITQAGADLARFVRAYMDKYIKPTKETTNDQT